MSSSDRHSSFYCDPTSQSKCYRRRDYQLLCERYRDCSIKLSMDFQWLEYSCGNHDLTDFLKCAGSSIRPLRRPGDQCLRVGTEFERPADGKPGFDELCSIPGRIG